MFLRLPVDAIELLFALLFRLACFMDPTNSPITRWRVMYLSTFNVYLSATPPILVFNRRAPARTILGGVDPTRDEVRKSTMNIL